MVDAADAHHVAHIRSEGHPVGDEILQTPAEGGGKPGFIRLVTSVIDAHAPESGRQEGYQLAVRHEMVESLDPVVVDVGMQVLGFVMGVDIVEDQLGAPVLGEIVAEAQPVDGLVVQVLVAFEPEATHEGGQGVGAGLDLGKSRCAEGYQEQERENEMNFFHHEILL